MPTNYEEACRRVNEVVSRVTLQIESGSIAKDVGDTIVKGFESMITEMKEAYLRPHPGQEEYHEYLHAEFALGVVPADMKQYDPSADSVRGLVGIGPDCDISKEPNFQSLTQKPD